MLGLLWDMSLPVGVTHDFVGKFSGRGFAVDGRYSGFGNFGLGVTLAWHILDQKTDTTTTWDAVTISGTQVREISSSPFTAKVFYALREQKQFIPYAGVGMGAARVIRRIDMGIASVTDESWHFAFVPELGVEVPLKAATVLASTRFNYFVKNNDGPAQLYMNFSLGIGFD
jgi:opacity protein-like surface antigen